MANKKVLVKANGVTTDSKININSCYIFLKVNTNRLLEDGVIDVDYFCYVNKEDQNDDNVKPFKLLKDDGTRLKNILDYAPSQTITELNYADECKLAFVAAMGWTANDVTIEDEAVA